MCCDFLLLVLFFLFPPFQATSLVNSSPRDDSQTEIGSIFTSIKPGKKEKEEHIFRRVKFALSAEKLSSEGTRPSDVNDCHRSPSPSRTVSTSSTVSSSGEVQGEYVVNAANSEDVGDRQHNEQHDCQDNGEGRGVEVELADDDNDDDDDEEEEEEEEDEEEEEEEEGDESGEFFFVIQLLLYSMYSTCIKLIVSVTNCDLMHVHAHVYAVFLLFVLFILCIVKPRSENIICSNVILLLSHQVHLIQAIKS